MNERTKELLSLAAETFADGADPFSDAFLREHKVTLDECVGLSELIAVLIKGYLISPPETQMVNALY